MAAEIRITINSTSSGSGVEQAKKDVTELGDSAKKAGGGFSALREIGVGALRELGSMGISFAVDAFKSLGGAIQDGIADAREAAKINAQTEAVLKSTGNAAGTSAQHIQDYASSLSAAAGKSLFGDDQIQQSENMLLTFTNIKGTVLDAATAISVDMAQALGGDPKDNAIQLGKALNDPIKGITALTRVGVTFSQEQKDLIKAMVDTGDTAGAQKIILEELNKEFGGSAEAAAKADGGMAQWKDRMGEVMESLGTAVLPLLNTFAGVLNNTIAPILEDVVVPAVQSFFQAFQTGAEGGDYLGGIINALYSLDTLSPIFDTIGDALVALPGLFDTVAAAFQPLVVTFTSAETPVQGFIDVVSSVSPILGALLTVVQSVLPSILYIVQSIFGDIQAFIAQNGAQMLGSFQATWTTIQATIQQLTAVITTIIQAFLTQIFLFWQAHGEEIMAFVQVTWNEINSIIQLAMQLIQATIVPVLQYLAGFIAAHSAEIQAILTVAWDTIKVIISTALGLIKSIIQLALAVLKGDWQGAWDTIKQIATVVWEALKALFKLNLDLITILFKTAWDGIKAYFQGIMDSIVGWVIQTFEAIKNAIVSSAGKLRSAAGGVADAIVSGIAGGISDGAGKIISAAKDAAMAALNAAKSALGISSPSKLFAEIGVQSAEGMAGGLTQGIPMVAGAGAGMAAAAAGGARTYNQQRAVTYSPTINNYGRSSDVIDYSSALALAGV